MKYLNLILTLKLFAAWIILLTIFALLGGIIFGGLNNFNLLSMANWDGRHFLEIAQQGYQNKIQYAFFPLYPILINIISSISGISLLHSALLISVASAFGIIYFFLLFLKENNYKNSLNIVAVLLIFPTSFYLISVYSESLFLLFTILTFYLAGKKKFYQAAIFAALSSSVRVAGVAVILALIFVIFREKTSLKTKIEVILLSSLGLLAYCTFLYTQTGNPFYFLISELSWERGVTLPGRNILNTIIYLTHFGIKPESFTLLSDLVFTVFGLGIAIRGFKNLKPSLVVYTWTALLLPLVTSLLLSIPRFLIVVFPLFILIAQLKNSIFKISYIVISLTLLFLYFNFFIRNIWVS